MTEMTILVNSLTLILLLNVCTIFSATSAKEESTGHFPGFGGYHFQYFIRHDDSEDAQMGAGRESHSLDSENANLRDYSRGFPIPFPSIKPYHSLIPSSSSVYPPVDIKVLPPSTTEPSKKVVEIFIDDEKAPENASPGPAIDSLPPATDSPLCPTVDLSDNRQRPIFQQRVTAPFSNVQTPFYLQPFAFKQFEQFPSIQQKNNAHVPPTLNPGWAFLLIPGPRINGNTHRS